MRQMIAASCGEERVSHPETRGRSLWGAWDAECPGLREVESVIHAHCFADRTNSSVCAVKQSEGSMTTDRAFHINDMISFVVPESRPIPDGLG